MGDTTMPNPLDTVRNEFINLARRAYGDDAAAIAAEAFRVTLAAHDAEVAANAWDEGAKWAAVECASLDERQPVTSFVAPGENPYRASTVEPSLPRNKDTDMTSTKEKHDA